MRILRRSQAWASCPHLDGVGGPDPIGGGTRWVSALPATVGGYGVSRADPLGKVRAGGGYALLTPFGAVLGWAEMATSRRSGFTPCGPLGHPVATRLDCGRGGRSSNGGHSVGPFSGGYGTIGTTGKLRAIFRRDTAAKSVMPPLAPLGAFRHHNEAPHQPLDMRSVFALSLALVAYW